MFERYNYIFLRDLSNMVMEANEYMNLILTNPKYKNLTSIPGNYTYYQLHVLESK